MSDDMIPLQEDTFNRRRFLRGAAATAVAAMAAGAGAAGYIKVSSSAVTLESDPVYHIPPPSPAYPAPADDLRLQLSSSKAENTRLRYELAAAQEQLSAFGAAPGETTARAETLTFQLAQANQEISILAGLVALYEQLDEVDLGDVLDSGLAAVAAGLDSLLAESPAFQQGIEVGRQALEEVEAQLPALENGRAWLSNQSRRLRSALDAVEQILAATLNRTGSLLQMLNDWFQDVLKWLPFGLGQAAEEVMQTMTTLLSETPEALDGLEVHVNQPIASFLGTDGRTQSIRTRLITPLHEQVLAPASSLLGNLEDVETTFREQVGVPVKTAVAHQQALRILIDQYRQTNQV